jgi:dCMP deaminase
MIDKDRIYLEAAQVLSKMSHCVRKKVATILVADSGRGKIISVGLNGTAPGKPNCDDVNTTEEAIRNHHEWSELYEIHSELSACFQAMKAGLSVEGSAAYCTLRPCINCMKHLVFAGVKKIFYIEDYDRYDQETYDRQDMFLEDHGVEIKQIRMGAKDADVQ